MGRSKYIKALDIRKNNTRLLSCNVAGNSYTIDFHQFEEADIIEVLKLLKDKIVVAHNPKFDSGSLVSSYGSEILPNAPSDTILLAALIQNACYTSLQRRANSDFKPELNLKWLCKHYNIADLDKEEQTSDFSGELTESQIRYAMNDVVVLPELEVKLLQQIKEMNMMGVAKLELEFLGELINIELTGIPINKKALSERLQQQQSRQGKLQNYFDVLDVNPNSWQQCLKHLNGLGVHVESTNKEALSHFIGIEFVNNLTELRTLKKEIDLIQAYLNTENGRLYTSYNQISSSSGRLSSRNPNVMQKPRTIKKKDFYKAFPGKVILRADYSQIELRLVAVIAQEPTMINLFQQDIDIHKYTASLITNIPYNQIEDENPYRDRAKPVNFGFIYGMSADSFIKKAKTDYNLEVTYDEAVYFRNTFLSTFTGIKRWHTVIGNYLRHNQAIRQSTLMGRLMLVDRFTDAVNYPVQGSGADLIKMATVIFGKSCRKHNIEAQIINLVHDEIIVEASTKDKERAMAILKKSMEKAANSLMGQYFHTEVDVEVIDESDH